MRWLECSRWLVRTIDQSMPRLDGTVHAAEVCLTVEIPRSEFIAEWVVRVVGWLEKQKMIRAESIVYEMKRVRCHPKLSHWKFFVTRLSYTMRHLTRTDYLWAAFLSLFDSTRTRNSKNICSTSWASTVTAAFILFAQLISDNNHLPTQIPMLRDAWRRIIKISPCIRRFHNNEKHQCRLYQLRHSRIIFSSKSATRWFSFARWSACFLEMSAHCCSQQRHRTSGHLASLPSKSRQFTLTNDMKKRR